VDGRDDCPALLLSNALGTTLELWDAQAEALSRTYRVIRYDTRGHGRSSVPAGDYTIGDLGRDAIAVLNGVGAATAYVCGISLGGLTAMWLGAYAPDRVKGLVLANTSARVGTPERWIERIEKVQLEGMAAVADMVIPNWFTLDYHRRNPGVVSRFHHMVASCSTAGYIGCCAALRDADLREEVRGIRAPTLIIAGELDPSTPLTAAEELRTRIAGSTLVTLPSAHLSNVEYAQAFIQHVDGFFAAHQP
jgi:3-oxoadipate enol-lactonase